MIAIKHNFRDGRAQEWPDEAQETKSWDECHLRVVDEICCELTLKMRSIYLYMLEMNAQGKHIGRDQG